MPLNDLFDGGTISPVKGTSIHSYIEPLVGAFCGWKLTVGGGKDDASSANQSRRRAKDRPWYKSKRGIPPRAKVCGLTKCTVCLEASLLLPAITVIHQILLVFYRLKDNSKPHQNGE